jgi:hypothetical protein
MSRKKSQKGSDKVTGEWSANGFTGDLVISYGDKSIVGFYEYIDYGKKFSTAGMAEDTNGNGVYDEGVDKIFGSFKANSKMLGGKIPPVASGRFEADMNSGAINLFYGNKRFGAGSIFDPHTFFDHQAHNHT